MSELLKRTTVYLEPNIHEALKLKSYNSGRSISELINEAVIMSLTEDELAGAADKYIGEAELSFEDLLDDLKINGGI